MLLTVDIGNTQITLGIFNGDNLDFTSRLATDRRRTSDQYAVELFNIFHIHNVEPTDFKDIIISSVVPELTQSLDMAIRTVTGSEPYIIQSDIGSGLKIVDEAVGQVGADLAAVSVGAINKYPLPCFILDLGTATKIILIDENGMFCGCTISAGVGISMIALASKTSQLPTISLTAPENSIGTNTVDCIKSGTVLGTAAMLDGLTARMEKDFGKEVKSTIATGGYAEEIVKNCTRDIVYDKNLIIYGLKKIYENMKTNKEDI